MATRKQSPAPMTDSELTALVGQQLQHARSYLSAEVASDRQANLRYYLNRPLGNEVEGRSQVISTDVQDTVESIMPDLVEMFAASGAIWKYQPAGPEDVPFIKQIDAYVFEVVWNADNDGFKITHDALKNTLLEKNAVFKIWWDDDRPTTQEVLREVSPIDIDGYWQDPNIEVLEAEPNMAGEVWTGLYDIKIERTQETGRCRVEIIPSEEFLVGTRVRELDETAGFCSHRRYMTRSELVEMGYDPEYVWNLPTIEGNNNANLDRSRVRHARFSDDRSALTDYGTQAESQREVEVYENYMLIDYDGDGISKRYLVRTAGFDGSTLMPDPDTGESAVEIDDHPFVSMEAIRQPGRFFPRAVADLVRDIQLIKSTIQRQTLDNMYNVNNQRSVVSSRVDLDDYLNNDVGAAITVDADTAVGHVVPVPPQPIIGQSLPLLEYWEKVGQDRTGIAGGAEPIDPKAFHETFGGANLMLGQMMKRLLFYARVMAETGFKAVGKKILRCIVQNQDAARVMRINNQWIPVEPRRWNVALDVKVNAGLGHGTKETRLAGAMQLGMMQEKIIAQVQKGDMRGPFVGPEEMSNTLDAICDSMSMDRSLYFKELTPQAMQALMNPPPPEPSELDKLAQLQAQIEKDKSEMKLLSERMDNQVDVLKIREDARQHNDEIVLKMLELEAKYDTEQSKLLLSYEQAEAQMEGEAAQEAAATEQSEDASEQRQALEAMKENMAYLVGRVTQLSDAAQKMNAPRRLIRDSKGRAIGSEIVPEGESVE